MKSHIRRVARAVTAFILGAVFVGLAASPAGAVPARGGLAQAQGCRWERLPASLPQAVYFAGTAWDSANLRLYLNGGLDAADSTRRVVQALDLSDADPAKATARLLAPSGPVQNFWGTAGAFRATSPSPDDSAVLFWGGGEGPGNPGSEGMGQKILQSYVPKSNVWTTASAGATGVLLAAAAADPGKDLAVFVGGVKRCDLFDITPANPLACADAQNQVTFMRFDPGTGAPLAQAGPTAGGPGRVFGGSLVLDTAGQRMLFFGGVDNAETGRARNTTLALDLSDPDPARARWTTLATAGQLPPARAFHGAAYDAARNWLVVYGGVGQGFFTTNESALTDTWALDLAQAPPRWLNLATNTPGQRVGAAMAFAANHQSVVLAAGRRAHGAGQQSVVRDVYRLSCGAGPVVTSTPPGPLATPTLPPPITAPPPVTPGPTAPPPAAGAQACPQLAAWRLVPDPVIADALANPGRYLGWQQPNNPAIAPGPYNPLRTFLSLAAPGKPYHPLFNTVVWKAGCP